MKLQKKLLNIAISILLCFALLTQTVSAAELFRSLSVQTNALDIVFAIDNGSEMYNYDYSGDNGWLDAFYGVMEQACPGSRFSVLSHEGVSEFTDMYTAEASLYEIPIYQGEANPIELLQAAENILRSTNQKMIVLSTPMCYNNSELSSKITELTAEGIMVYLVAFEKDSEKAESIKETYENVVVCSNTHEVSIRMSDLYEYLVSSPQTYSLANRAAETYKSSFRMGKHNYSFTQNAYQGGSYLVQLLNMYYLFPTFTDGYGPLDYGQCVEASKGNTFKMFQNTNSAMQTFEYWNDIADELLANNYYSTYQAASEELSLVAEERINKNLKRRYPVFVKAGTQNYYLITRVENGIYYVNGSDETVDLHNKPVRVLDTELYIQAVLETFEIGDDLTISGNTPTVKITLPEGGAEYYDSYYNSVNTTDAAALQITRSNAEFVISVKTEFTGVLPVCHRTNRYYNINIFRDITNNLWSKEYIFDMLNRGVVHGYEDNSFQPDGKTTIAEFLVMLIYAADIPISTDIPEGKTWAYPYIDYAQTKGWWPVINNEPFEFIDKAVYTDFVYTGERQSYTAFDEKGTTNPDNPDTPENEETCHLMQKDLFLSAKDNKERFGYDTPITREFAFYLLWKIAVSEDCRTPNHLIDYPNSNAASKFHDYEDISDCFKSAVNNLKQNDILAGSIADDGTNRLYPQKPITRAEACRILSFAMFGFDQNGDFKYPVVEERQINEINMNETEATVSGRTNEYMESLHTFTVEPEKTGLYKFSFSEQSDGRLTINVYDEKFRQMEEVANRAGYYRLMGNAKYYVSVHGAANVSYTLQVGGYEENNTKFSISGLSYNNNEGPMLGYGNKMQISISKNTEETETYYVVPALGWSEDNLYERNGQTVTLKGTNEHTLVFDNIDLTSGGNQTLYTGVNVYTNSAKDELLSAIDLGSVQRSNKPMPADLELKKSSNVVSMFTGKKIESNILYVNNPETIAEDDIIQPITNVHGSNHLIYQQDNITNYNTLYITHSTKDMEDHPLNSFWYDVDFYSDTDVTIKMVKPYVRINNTWKGYVALKDLYLERLWRDHEYVEIEIESGQHRLLFQDILPNEFGVYDEFKMQPKESFLGLFVDFEVEAGKEITVSSLATDKRDYLNLKFENNTIKAGFDNAPLVLDGSPFILAGRVGEYDTYRKMKGKEKGTTDVISGELKYIIDDNTTDGILPIQITDDFYGESYTSYDSKWVANINPIADQFYARLHAMPSNLFTYEYTDENGDWIFNFKYLNPKAATSATPPQILNVMEESNYQNPKLNDKVLVYYRNTAKAGHIMEVPYPIMEDSGTWEDYVMMMGNWGISYVYKIDIKNDGQNIWYLKYLMELKNIIGATYVVRDAETNEVIPIKNNLYTGITIDSTSGREEHTIFEIPIPAGKHYVITVSNLNGVGDAGFTNWLEISREKTEGND